MPPAHTIEVPLFAGHGSSSLYASHTRELALRDAQKSTTTQFLLASCHHAFLQELKTLSPDERFLANINLDDFHTPESLLTIPTDRYLHNAILSGSALFLIQSLRYLAFLIDHSAFSNSPKSPLTDILNANLHEQVGILGFSSGILPAIVAASSPSPPSFISHALEAYRLALWIGVRVQTYRESARRRHCGTTDPASSWGLVVLGMDIDAIEQCIASMGHQTTVCVTVVTEDGGVTVSGHPEHLKVFASQLPSHVVTSATSLETLYHSALHGAPGGVRDEVLLDLERRDIRFPQYSDLRVPVRSTWDGSLLWRDSSSQSLVTKVIDLLLTHRVNWDTVSGALRKCNFPLRFINVGPGAGLCRSMIRTLGAEKASILDLTNSNTTDGRTAQKQVPIAIVGMALNVPGAPDVAGLWKVLEDGINTVTEIPECRFKVTDYEGQNLMGSRTMKTRTGNFVSNADEFDSTFFRISPREAKSMDPQQRLLLHASYEALEDAGYVPNSTPSFRRETLGVYVGAATHDYLENLRNDIDVYYSTGTLKSFLSGRISYAMQFSGPSVVVDTACSSSAVAIYQGCRALMNGDCNAALVGGVNVISSPDMYLGLDRGHFLSPTGQCKPFDASADGYSRSEGVVMFVIKRLSDAIAENDHILGVIRGAEVNQCGLAHSITHPHAETQAALFKQLLANSGVSPEQVNVVEAHGTGTRAGDPNELKSIRSVFCTRRTAVNPLHVTSIKANIGHLEAASGAAGLAKLLLMFQHRAIPPQISLKTLNPNIAPLEQDNTVIDTRMSSWSPSSPSKTRFAVLNNFGAAGSNSTLLLEEHVVNRQATIPPDMPLVFGLSAKTEMAVHELRGQYLKWLERPENKDISLSNIAYTSTARRQVYGHRLAFSLTDFGDLQQKLARADIVCVGDKPSQIVFVFSGQSAQYQGMGQALYKTSPTFKDIVDECDAYLRWSGFSSVLPVINAETRPFQDSSAEFETYQTSQFVLQLALAKLWMSWGVRPSAVIGHSLGEYAALVTAEVISWQDALVIVATRARLMVQYCAPNVTGMIAINLGSEDVQTAISSSPRFSQLTIACYNTPNDCVVSGPVDQVKAFKSYIEDEYHCRSTVLNVPFGYHSAAMTPILHLLEKVCAGMQLHPPRIPIVSNVFGTLVMPGDLGRFDATYFARHCAEPVLFDRGVTALTSEPRLPETDVWIEIGPHPTTLPMLKVNASFPSDGLLLPSLRKKQDHWATLMSSLAQLYLLNVPIMWRAVYSHIPAACISLPSYPFSKKKYWVPYKENSHAAVGPSSGSSMGGSLDFFTLNRWRQMPSLKNGYVAIFETPISDLADSIRGHLVGGTPLCPGSIYTEQVFAGVQLASRHLGKSLEHTQVSIREMDFTKPLVYNDSLSQTVLVTITLSENGGHFRISSSSNHSQGEVLHVHGQYRLVMTSELDKKFAYRYPVIERQMAAVVDGRRNLTPEVFSSRTVYGVIFPRVVQYTSPYQSIQSLTVDPNGMEARAIVKIPTDGPSGHVVHPVFIDTLLHVSGFMANMHGTPGDAYICSKIDGIKVIADRVDVNATYQVYCSNAWLADQGVMLCEAWAVKDGNPKAIVAHAKGIHFRRLQLSSLQRSLSMTAGSALSRRSSGTTRPNVNPVARHVVIPSKQEAQQNTVPTEVLNIIAETFDMPLEDINLSDDLNSIGADSLMLIELLARIKIAFPSGGLCTQDLTQCSSIRDIVNEISAKMASSASTPTLVQEKLPECERPLSGLSEHKGDVKIVLAQVLGLEAAEVTDEADLGDLGLDSLTSIEALKALEEAFSVDIPATLFADHSTPHAIQSYITRGLRSNEESCNLRTQAEKSPDAPFFDPDYPPIELISRSSADTLPLFLFHDGSGSVSYYSRLNRPFDRQTWGISNPIVHSGVQWEDLTQMANQYAALIIPKITGPVLLGGWSFGGVLAYEVAQQLLAQGYVIKGIVLIDSPSPCDHVPLSDPLIDAVLSRIPRMSPAGRDLFKQQFQSSTSLLAAYHPSIPDECPPLVLLRCKQGVQLDGVPIPQWLGDRSDLDVLTSGWTKFTRQDVKVYDLPGTHFEVFSPENLEHISEKLLDACSYLEGLAY